MCNLSSYLFEKGMERGIEQGMEQGKKQGKIIVLNNLVQEKILTVEEAAEWANMSVEAFSKAVAAL